MPMASSEAALRSLLARPEIWRAGQRTRPGAAADVISTGHATLDQALPEGGWPKASLVDILYPHPGCGELSLLLPVLRRITQNRRWIAMVAPPLLPYAPALAHHGVDLSHLLIVEPPSQRTLSRQGKDLLWASEQLLNAPACAAVLIWPQPCTQQQLRRLLLAARDGRTSGFLFNDVARRQQPSPASVRIAVDCHDQCDVFKARGGRAPGRVALPTATDDAVKI